MPINSSLLPIRSMREIKMHQLFLCISEQTELSQIKCRLGLHACARDQAASDMVSCRVSSYFGCWSLERGARSIAVMQMVQHVIGLIKCIINIGFQFSSIDVIFRKAFNLDIVLLVATALGIVANGLLLYGVM